MLVLLGIAGLVLSACYQAPAGFGGPDAADDASVEDGGHDASADGGADPGQVLRRGCACRAPASAPSGNGGLALLAMLGAAATVLSRRRASRR